MTDYDIYFLSETQDKILPCQIPQQIKIFEQLKGLNGMVWFCVSVKVLTKSLKTSMEELRRSSVVEMENNHPGLVIRAIKGLAASFGQLNCASQLSAFSIIIHNLFLLHNLILLHDLLTMSLFSIG